MGKKRMRKIIASHAFGYVQIILLAVLLAFNYQLFVVENGFAPAGINGIATMVQYKTGFSIAYMSLLINVPLCIWAWFAVDKTFARRSLCFCVVYSGVFLYLQMLGLETFQYAAADHEVIFPVVLSGVFSGLVYGFCFRVNASTGGTDIVSKYISKRWPMLNFFWVTFILNAVVAVSSFFVYAQQTPDGGMLYTYKPVCLSVMYSFVSSFTGNQIVRGTKTAYRFTVVTTHAEEISAEVLHTLRHGGTKLSGIGVYSNAPRDVLICVVSKHQLIEFQDILKKYDNTFAFSEMVNEIYGNFAHIEQISLEKLRVQTRGRRVTHE